MKVITMYSDNEDFEAIYFLLRSRSSWIDRRSGHHRDFFAEKEVIRRW